MIGTIKLTRFATTPDAEDAFARHNWPLAIYASATGEMPEDVFVFQKATGLSDPVQYDQFRCVASAHDIFEIPKQPTSNVDDELDTPFYRGSQLRLFLRSPSEVEEVWTKIKSDVTDLVRNLESENRLKAVDVTTLTPLDTTPVSVDEAVDQLEQIDQVLLTLDYRPCGIAEVDGSNNQTISSPDDSVTGWLPVSEAPSDWNVPGNAAFFYNTTADLTVAAELPLLEPGSQHLFYINGTKLGYGNVYAINSDGIFWLNYDPVGDGSGATNNDEQTLAYQGLEGNAPWPLDYVDRNNPGSSVPNLELLLFRE